MTEKQYLGGDTLYLLPSVAHTQSMGIVLKSDKGVAVIDGGTANESLQLEELLSSLGGVVDGWFLTHPHHDHIQALIGILERGKIKINKIYYDFPDEEYIARIELRDRRVSCVPALKKAIAEAGAKSGAKPGAKSGKKADENSGAESDIKSGVKADENSGAGSDIKSGVKAEKPIKGKPIYAAGFTFLPLSEGKAFADDLNCSSVAYKIKTRGDDVLILGDMNYKRQQELIDEFGDILPTPIVQMAHHGQQGVNEEFYKLVGPEVCLWCTPRWLWENDPAGKGYDSGPYKTIETRGWIEKIGAKNVTAFDKTVMLK
ncbi:MAG: MBL fold metallo-hydrolase [Clostridia bacterium]|nr:MBL fold metallo-hydrolase [Clostridia bacterium]MDY2900631.1 MBL fold metallo-hydrolase [Christensenellaceae bacterium]